MKFDKLFDPGDYISISTHQGLMIGKVIAIESKVTKLESILGNIVMIPNSLISSASTTNLSEKEKYLKTSVVVIREKEVAEVL